MLGNPQASKKGEDNMDKPKKKDPSDRKEYAKDEWWGHGYNQAYFDWERYHKQEITRQNLVLADKCDELDKICNSKTTTIDVESWHKAFGTTQLTHAIARLEEAERKASKMINVEEVIGNMYKRFPIAVDGGGVHQYTSPQFETWLRTTLNKLTMEESQ